MVNFMSPPFSFLILSWLVWICSATQQQQGAIGTPFLRPTHVDCDGDRIACEALQRSGMSSDRTVHGFLLLPESQTHWQAFPVGLMLSQRSLSVRNNTMSRMLFLLVGVFLMGALAYWLHHAEEPEEHDDKDELLDPSSPARPWVSAPPWEEAYQNAKGTQKEAFELLFRTYIVPKMDRQSEMVNRGHIEQCVCVAEQMIREKPLQEWLQGPETARRTFEHELAEVYRTSPPPTPSTQDKLMPLATQSSPTS
jgi:hypothetical protein